MKILLLHNYYQVAGGEDGVFLNEVALLKNKGHKVISCSVDNTSITSVFNKFCLFFSSVFSFSQYRKVKQVLRAEVPDVVHVHNYFPMFSPSIFFACKKLNIPVVHTLHNYRAVCPTALLMHDGKIEETSIKRGSWWAVRKRVYRNSLIGSAALATMVEFHKWRGTWQTKVDCFIALTEFAKSKYIEAGWPADKIIVKSNFCEDTFKGQAILEKKGGYALYAGRLCEEKGIDVLLTAWNEIDLPLKVIGDGPLTKVFESNSLLSVEYLGRKNKSDVLNLVQNADFIIMPSTWYEGFPMVLVEAFACGTPALVSKLGSMEEIIVDGITGLHFDAGDPGDLAAKVQWMMNNLNAARNMGVNARSEYLAKYTPQRNHEMLMEIYQQAIEGAKRNRK